MRFKAIEIEGHNEQNGVPALSCSWSGPGWYGCKAVGGVEQCSILTHEDDREAAEALARGAGEAIVGWFNSPEELASYWREFYPNAKVKQREVVL